MFWLSPQSCFVARTITVRKAARSSSFYSAYVYTLTISLTTEVTSGNNPLRHLLERSDRRDMSYYRFSQTTPLTPELPLCMPTVTWGGRPTNGPRRSLRSARNAIPTFPGQRRATRQGWTAYERDKRFRPAPHPIAVARSLPVR